MIRKLSENGERVTFLCTMLSLMIPVPRVYSVLRWKTTGNVEESFQ